MLDAMRALAVLCVVTVHVYSFSAPGSAPIPGVLAHLNLGVTIFFLISGFLLYRPFIAHRSQGPDRPGFLRYARRRALRILPAYWLALTVLTIIPGALGVGDGSGISRYALVHTLSLNAAGDTCVFDVHCGLAQTWSLAVEASFYLALPLLFLASEFVATRISGRRWVGVELIGLAILSAGSVVLRATPQQGPSAVISGTLIGSFLWFALGMSLAVVSVAIEGNLAPGWLRALRRFPAACWLIAVAMYALLAIELPASAFLLSEVQFRWIHLAFAAIAFLLLLPAIFADPGKTPLARLLGHPTLAWVGLVSYGVFLWHYVIALRLGSDGAELGFWPLLAATLIASLLAATLSYYLLERPLLRRK
ncbi:acyltransferase [soil metagenome]